MSPDFQPVFTRLRAILQQHAGRFTVTPDAPDRYGLEAPVGQATIEAWRGKMKSSSIPVAWVQVGKAYVSYHLMGVYGNPKLLAGCSQKLKARMQGKSCFNFTAVDEPLFEELERLTAESLTGMSKAGYISEPGGKSQR